MLHKGTTSGTTKQQIEVLPGLFHLPTSSSDKPYLIGSKCKLCGYVSFPKRVVCPACVKGITMEEVALSRYGTVSSFSISRVAPPGFTVPYIQSFVELDEGPRIFSLITGCEPEEKALQIGMRVELVIGKICEDEKGNDVIGYQFQPIKKNQTKKRGRL